MTRPDPFREIRLLRVRTLEGPSFWARRPIVRLDVRPGVYDDISSREVDGFTEALTGALPGLGSHRCSVGAPGGFVTRLERGTYAPHIIEHVALELQAEIGHDIRFGRARGGDREGEYTVALGYRSAAVGRAAAHAAVEIVRHAFAGLPIPLDRARHLVATAARRTDPPSSPVSTDVLVAAAHPQRHTRYLAERRLDLEVTPVRLTRLLSAGLRHRAAHAVIVGDLHGAGLPPRYRDPERLATLASVAGDAVPEGGVVIVPAGSLELVERLRDARRTVGIFAADGRLGEAEARLARGTAVADEAGGRLWCGGTERRIAPSDAPVAPRLAGVLLSALGPTGTAGGGAALPRRRSASG